MTVVASRSSETGAVRPSLVGRQVFVDGRTATVTSLAGDMALTDRAGSLPVERVRASLLPLSGEKVVFHGKQLVWLETDLFSSCPAGWALTETGEVEHHSGAFNELVSLGELEDQRLVEVVFKQHQRYQSWKQTLAVEAREWADENDLCERFDDFMETHGMEGRTREYDAEITVTFRRDITGRDWDDAAEDVTDERIIEWLTTGVSFDTSVEEV